APVAPLFADHALFENAAVLRNGLGDEKFFAPLNQGTQADSRWGKKVAEAWNGARFDAACNSTSPKERAGLFSALVKTHFPAFIQQSSSYLPFETGMLAMTRHAGSLGYDGMALFLD